MRTPTLLFAAMVLAAACGGDDAPADVAGNYTVAVTNDDNGCQLDNWTDGDSAENIAVVIAQDEEDPSQVSVDVEGIAGSLLDLWLGASVFEGTVGSDDLDATITGTRSHDDDMGCTWTFDADLHADIEGDVLTGEIRYRARTNDAESCGTRTGCMSVQAMNGTRPPST